MISNPNGLYVTDEGIVTHNSTLTVLCNLYIATQFGLMYAPYKYYGYSPSTKFTIAMGGFSQKKAGQLLTDPLLNVLRQSDYFVQCIREDEMIKANKELTNSFNGVQHLYWTRATGIGGGVLQMSNGLSFHVVSSNGDIIGQNIIMGSATELSFWKEEGGWSDERIYEFFTKLRDRIDSRMKGNRISGFILDSKRPQELDIYRSQVEVFQAGFPRLL